MTSIKKKIKSFQYFSLWKASLCWVLLNVPVLRSADENMNSTGLILKITESQDGLCWKGS